jgi:hypothetical protein
MLKRIRWLGWAIATCLANGAAAQATYGFATLPPGSILHAQASVSRKSCRTTPLQIRVIGFGGDTGILEAVNSKNPISGCSTSAAPMHSRVAARGRAIP